MRKRRSMCMTVCIQLNHRLFNGFILLKQWRFLHRHNSRWPHSSKFWGFCKRSSKLMKNQVLSSLQKRDSSSNQSKGLVDTLLIHHRIPRTPALSINVIVLAFRNNHSRSSYGAVVAQQIANLLVLSSILSASLFFLQRARPSAGGSCMASHERSNHQGNRWEPWETVIKGIRLIKRRRQEARGWFSRTGGKEGLKGVEHRFLLILLKGCSESTNAILLFYLSILVPSLNGILVVS